MATTSTAVSAPPAYYSVNNPHDPIALLSRELARREYELWRALSVDLDPGQDIDVLAASIARSTGFGRRAIQNNLMAMLTLDELPRLRAFQEQLWHLDGPRLRAIDIALCAADRSYFDAVDEQLTDYLTATRPNQLLPGPRAIRNRIKAILDSLDDTLDTDEPDWPDDSYRLKINPDGTADLSARFSAADAAEIDARVRALAVAENLTLAEAHVALLRGHEGVQVHLNIYRAWDVPDSPAFLHRAGWLDQESTEELVERATHVRDMDEAASMTPGSYRTPEALRAYLEGRDGDCRGPACTCPATAAQQDHRINHADGGPTSAENLASLCQRHHNLKTSGALFYVMDPHTGDIVWLLEDGTWFYDEPEGPLSRRSRRWLQTLARRREERHTRVRREAQERRQMKERARRSHDDPPPF